MTLERKRPMFEYTEDNFAFVTPNWEIFAEDRRLSEFDKRLQTEWDKALKNGHFRYGMEDVKSRVLPGKKHYLLQLNIKRGIERRKPQDIQSVSQPFNHEVFNFTKIKNEEILFEMQSVNNKRISDQHSSVEQNDTVPPLKRKKRERNIVIINVSPLEYGHVLLVPDVDSCHPQILSQHCIQLGLEMMLLSSHPGFRVGFNSLCAFASVNHQHIHAYYTEQELFVEYVKAAAICPGFYELAEFPTRGFVFQLYGYSVTELAKLIFTVTNYFQDKDIAHNLMLVRGPVIGEDRLSKNRTVRVLLFPRLPTYGAKSESNFNIAVAELCGHLPVKVADEYETLTEKDVDLSLASVSYSQEKIDCFKYEIKDLLQKKM